MPTGYTADLHDGKEKTFAEFAMACARAFGALITMRDDGADAQIPEQFEPDACHRESLEKAKLALAEAEQRSLKDWESLERADREQTVLAIEASARKRGEIRARYEAMLAHVRGWQPPSSEHQELKSFMVQQLEESIRFDCSDTSSTWNAPSRRSPQSFRDAELTRSRRALERAWESWAAEVERAEKRSWWVRELRESLAAA